jgi:hypothetical protein
MSSTKPAGVDRLAQLNALHLYGMATAWSELLADQRFVGASQAGETRGRGRGGRCNPRPGWIA